MAVHVPVVAVYSASSKGGFYGMRITSLHFVVLHTFLDSICKQLTMVSSKARNLLRPNNLSGDLTDDFVNNFISFFA